MTGQGSFHKGKYRITEHGVFIKQVCVCTIVQRHFSRRADHAALQRQDERQPAEGAGAMQGRVSSLNFADLEVRGFCPCACDVAIDSCGRWWSAAVVVVRCYFQFCEVLGRGNSSEVFKAVHKGSGTVRQSRPNASPLIDPHLCCC